MRRAALAIGALAMVATLAAGCGGSDDEADNETNAEATATVPPTTAATTTSTAAVDKPTGPELSSLLLTAAEMGEGWVVTPPEPDDDDDLGCVTELEEDGTLDTTKAEVQFEYGGGQAVVIEGTRWAGEDPFETIDAVVDAIDDCPLGDAGDGTTIDAIDQISFPRSGDDTVAWQLTFTGADGVTYTAHLILAVQDDILIQVLALLANSDITETESQPIIEGAVQKVASLY
jgi:hypothetical protein